MLGLVFLVPVIAQAQVPATPSDYTRTSTFTYYGAADGSKNGLLASETVEPGGGAAVVTTYTYDDYGNKISAVTQNAGSPTGRSTFTPRNSSSTYPTSAYSQTVLVNGTATATSVAAGLFATTLTNAASQSEIRTYDPRFGAALTLKGPNGLTTTWTVDDFGRKVLETRVDGTSTVLSYCLRSGFFTDTSSNSPACANLSFATNEVPAPAVMFVHSEDHDKSGAKMSPYTRVYSDAFGRTVRTVTESFDGAGQSNTSVVVRDTVYNAAGVKTIQTDPYFLSAGVGGGTEVVYDVLGRPTYSYVFDDNASTTRSEIFYNVVGYVSKRVAMQTVAYNGLTTITTNDKGQTRTEQKNANGEVILVTDALNAQIAYQRDAFGNLIKTVDALGNAITLSYDTRGRKVSMSDTDTGTWSYDYDALGQLVWQQSANQKAAGQQTTIAYDLLGRMTQRVEPEYTSTWTYDSCTMGVGKLCQSTTSNGLTRQIAYDTMGRVAVNRTTVSNGPAFGGAFGYDATTGRLATQTYPTGLQVGYAYTARGFLSQLLLRTAATVNPLPATPGGAAGASVSLAANSVLWQAQSVNARGQIEQQAFGNGVVGRAGYGASTGRIASLSAGVGTATNVQSNVYTWDTIGNLTVRSDANGDGTTGTTENFTYGDKLNRLTQYSVLASNNSALNRTVNLQYNALGMLLAKDDVGGYTYPGAGAAHPHALQKLLSATANTSSTYTYDANGNLLTATAGGYRSVAYNSFNLPDSQNGVAGPMGGSAYTWQYDENHARIKETRTSSQGTRTTWELHPDSMGGLGFESEINAGGPYNGAISQRHYLTAGGQVIGVLVSTGSLPALAAWPNGPQPLTSITLAKVEYWHKDHLGSTAATTDHAGNLTARYAYDPFGKRRNTNGTYDPQGTLIADYSPATNNGADRGYTGHEHLDDVGIVHMNGRLFDPKLGIFMQSDPVIQDPGQMQGYNRYGYCLNNPLGCTDPSGFNWFTKQWHKLWNNRIFKTAVVVVAAYYSGGWALDEFATSSAATAGFSAASTTAAAGGDAIGAFATASQAAYVAASTSIEGGAIAGAAGGFTGGLVGSNGSLKAAAEGAITGAVTGGINGIYGSQYPVDRIAANSVAGGMGSVLRGESFGKGFRSSLVISSLVYLNTEMRQTMISQSQRDLRNDGAGLSNGLNGDGFKLAGGRWFLGANIDNCSPLGCWQSSAGSVFGVRYASGGLTDMIVESFAGPHDMANSRWWYVNTLSQVAAGLGKIGDALPADYYSLTVRTILEYSTNYTTSLIFASPFAAAAIFEQSGVISAVTGKMK